MNDFIGKIKRLDKSVFLIFGIALILRLLYLFQIQDSPFLHYPQIDALWHHIWAQEIASGNIIGKEIFFRAPLYPYFLGLVYAIFGDGPNAIRIIQSIIGSLSCALIYLIALKLSNKKVALIAGLISSIYPIFIYFDNELLIANIFIFLTLLLFYMTIRTKPGPKSGRIYLIGLICGLAAIARPTILLFLPIVIFYLLFYISKRKRFNWNKCVQILVMLAGLFTVILPITIRNYIVGKDLVLISYQGGVNFWIGNNAQADGKTAGAPGYYKSYEAYEDNVKFSSEKVAEDALGRTLKPSEISSYWYDQGFDFIMHHPGDFIKLDLKKLYYSWNAYEIQSNRDIYSQREYSSLFSILLWHNILGFPFGIIAPLALAGLFILFRKWNSKYLLLLGIIAVFQIILVTFFVTSRFRAPMLPYSIILAAMTIDYAIRNFKKKSRLVTPAIFFIVSLVISNSALFGIMPEEKSRNYQTKASIFLRENQLDSAIVYGRLAVNENPNDPAGYDFLGTSYELSKDYKNASEAYQKAVNLSPEDAFAYNHLGYCLYKLGRLPEAAEACSRALKIDPSIVEAYTYLGAIYKDMGQTDRALQITEKGYALDSSNIPLLNNYSVILREEGNYQKAIQVLERVVTLMPDYLPAHTNLGNLYFQTGNLQKAESQYLAALQIDPDETQTNLNLAELYLRSGRTPQAVSILNKVLEKNPDNPMAKRLLERAASAPH